MKYLFIAEKPTVMNAVKETYQKHKTEIISKIGEIEFTALAGHVCRWLEPDEYPQWKGLKWAETDLPMIPDPFVVSYIPEKVEIIKRIKNLLRQTKFDGIIVGTDSDTEGNGIFYLLREFLKLPSMRTLRYFESTLTDKDILRSLFQMTDFDRNPRDVQMTESYLVRSHGDWIVGMNATRALTVKTGEKMRVGRVKAPTLKLVYDNSKAIDEFVPHSDYLIKAMYAEGFTGYYCSKEGPVAYETQKEAEDFIRSMQSLKTATVLEIQRKNVKTEAPKLYKLATIQSEAGTKYNYTPQKTLDLIQSLYEKKLVSYPRTNGEFVSSQKALEFPTLLESVRTLPDLAPFVAHITDADIKRTQQNPRIVNDKEVQKESHDALLPTEKKPDLVTLSQDEINIYDMICRRLLGHFLPVLIEEKVILLADIAGLIFKSNGTSLVQKGWTELYNRKTKGEVIPASVVKNTALSIAQIEPHEKKSVPPKRLTEASLVEVMEHISKYISDKALRATMNAAEGIGQPSTRGTIISELIRSGYMESRTKANQLFITDMGKRYIESLKDFTITDPIQAAEWETMFQGVRNGTVNYHDAERQFHTYITDFVRGVEAMNIQPVSHFQTYEKHPCPYCGKKIFKLKWGYACEDSRNGCGFKVSNFDGKVKDSDMDALLTKGVTRTIKNIAVSAKTGKAYDAKIRLEAKGSAHATKFEFDSQPSTTAYSCPYCQKPITTTSWGFACEDYKKGCNFSVSNFNGKFKEKDLKDLIEKKETRLIKAIGKSKSSGNHYDASVTLNPKGSQYVTGLKFAKS